MPILFVIIALVVSNVIWQAVTEENWVKAFDRSLAQVVAIIVYVVVNAFTK